ncbi:MAG: type II toxin-antitoxin system Phd/YefM family antitoxin [Planctomycetes bacterium]|nr:type II toxin-antitoxin system Phd/YefM family antitoxin [Planctomycetota bacterium]
MRKIAVSKFKATCLAVLESVKRTGEPILITKRNEPLAQVLPPPVETGKKSWFGCMAGTVEILGDIMEPIGVEDWEALQ